MSDFQTPPPATMPASAPVPGKQLACLLFPLVGCIVAWSAPPAFPPASVTRTQDRDQMMWQLHLSFPKLPPKLDDPNAPPNTWPVDPSKPNGNWTDAAGHTVIRSGFGLWSNYDDTAAGFFPGPQSWRVGRYTPINLLAMDRPGTSLKSPDSATKHQPVRKITTAEQWWTQRRPELLRDVQTQMWGVIPKNTPAVTWSVKETKHGSGKYPYIQKLITGKIDVSSYPEVRNVPTIKAYMRVPTHVGKRVPVIVIFSPSGVGYGRGNFNLRYLEQYWKIISPQGYAVCIFDPTVLQPDDGQYLTSYLIGLCNKGHWRKPSDWGTLAAWSWGVSRLIDYFATDPAINARKVAISGHSRYGKAAIVSMAYDQRIAIAFPSCGGSLGTKMNRRHWGQDLEDSSWDHEYQWMAGNFFKWMGPLHPGSYLPRKIELCPVDAHSLLALCAPRPVFLNGGNQDTWTDPYGIYLTAVAATPVYKLLGGRGLVMPDPKPRLGVAYIKGDIGYRYHNGGHTDIPDWPAFLKFARPYLMDHAPVVTPAQTFTPERGHGDRLGTVTATDADGAPLQNWQITGGRGAASFRIDPRTGVLSYTASWHPGAARRTVRLSVTVSDGIDTSPDQTISIRVPEKFARCRAAKLQGISLMP